jgi:hypothetical protein
MKPHADKKIMDKLFPYIREYQELAERHGIGDSFQDNGGKPLQIVLTTGLRILPSREGNDAVDENGREYELKSVNILLTASFSTHHHMNPTPIAKYRKAGWVFAVYKSIELQRIYLLTPEQMEAYFTRWEKKSHKEGGKDINNPKVPLRFVEGFGRLVYGVKGSKSPPHVPSKA